MRGREGRSEGAREEGKKDEGGGREGEGGRTRMRREEVKHWNALFSPWWTHARRPRGLPCPSTGARR